MSWETIGVISELIAAAAVVASLIYLAGQVRDGKNSTISATHYQVTESINTAYSDIAKSSELSRIYIIGNRDPSKLTRDELPRYMILIGGIFARCNNYYLQHEKGTLTDESWEIAFAHMRSLIEFPGVKLWWQSSRQHYLSGMKTLLGSAMEATDSNA